jgi:hypothetical protein
MHPDEPDSHEGKTLSVMDQHRIAAGCSEHKAEVARLEPASEGVPSILP